MSSDERWPFAVMTVARLPRGTTVTTLRSLGLNARRLADNRALVRLPPANVDGNVPGGTMTSYLVPSGLARSKARLESCESGGTGWARVVCDPTTGWSLQPSHTWVDPGNRQMARFASFKGLSLVQATLDPDTGQLVGMISELSLAADGHLVHVIESLHWEGVASALPRELERYRIPLTAAQTKALCPHCCHVHYQRDKQGRPIRWPAILAS